MCFTEEFFSEPGEADSIIDEARTKLLDLLNKESKDVLDQVKVARKEVKNKSNILREKEKQIKILEAQIEELNNKKINIENREYPQKLINAMVKELTGNFAPGDKVWVARPKYTKSHCDMCNGTGRVSVTLAGAELNIWCPTCGGNKHTSKYVYVPVATTIHDVYCQLCFDKNRVSYWTTSTIILEDKDERQSLNGIFKTEEECIEYCNKKNKEEHE